MQRKLDGAILLCVEYSFARTNICPWQKSLGLLVTLTGQWPSLTIPNMTLTGCGCKCKTGLLSRATSSTCPVTRVSFFTSEIYNGLAASGFAGLLKILTRASIWCMRQQYSLEETSIKWVLLFTMGMVQIFFTLAILYFFLVHVKSV